MKGLLVRLLANAAALAVAIAVVGGITLTSPSIPRGMFTLLAVAAVFGLVNALVKPVVRLLTLPLYVLTLGLFTFVVNALMLLLTSWLAGLLGLPFHVTGFGAALLGALVVTLVSFLVNTLLPD